MVSSSKILTVSYGTFSCTLEGFDDSFETMKAIAEYFRDLAADDRYFGAEPPTPDAEMLARIAEREIARRVEARMEAGGIVLRPSIEAAPAQPPSQPAPGDAGAEPTAEHDASVPAGRSERAEAPQDAAPATTSFAMDTSEGAEERTVALVEEAPEAGFDAAMQADAEHSAPEPTAHEAPEPAPQDTTAQASDALESDTAADDAGADSPRTGSREAPPSAPATREDSFDVPARTDAPEDAEAALPASDETTAGIVLHEEATLDAETPEKPDATVHEDPALEEAERGPAEMDAALAEAAPHPAQAEAEDLRPQTMPGSVAAKLQRIRAVVARATAGSLARDERGDEQEANLFREDDASGRAAPSVLRMNRDEYEAALAAGRIRPQGKAGAPAAGTGAERETGGGAAPSAAVQPQPAAPMDAASAPDTTLHGARGVPEPAAAPDDAVAQDRAGHDPASDDAAAGPTDGDASPDLDATPEIDASPDIDATSETAGGAEADVAGLSGDVDPFAADDIERAEAVSVPIEERQATAQQSSLTPEDEAELAAELREIEADLYRDRHATPASDEAWDAETDDAGTGVPEAPAPGNTTLQAAVPDAPDAAHGTEPEPAGAEREEAAYAGAGTDRDAWADEDPQETDAPPRELAPEDARPDASQASGPDPEIVAGARRATRQASIAHDAVSARPDGNGTDNVSRLMTEAETELERPESTRRRSALAHLRAAVAATRADRKLAQSGPAEEDVQTYRDDLAEAVRPRRPETVSARTPRPEEPRPAPLKLVAEQRVDLPEGAERAQVRPRRVSRPESEAAPVAAAHDEFLGYARARGARELPELMEAAAAYLVFVEGHEQFSRPQVMKTVRMSGLTEFSREDGLRHFGQLIREGKIEKQRGGRFTVSDEIGYRPEGRAAG